MDSDEKAVIAVIAAWVFILLANVAFWAALIWLGFYAVNKFAS